MRGQTKMVGFTMTSKIMRLAFSHSMRIGVENYVVVPAHTCRSRAMESPQGACL